MSNVVKLTFGRAKRGRKLPKPVPCKDCDDPIETARLQATANDIMRCVRCVSCQNAWERRFEREMAAVRDYQAVEIIR
jgi:hypothetical protein